MPLKEIPGDYVHLRGLYPQTYWTAKCPVKHCGKSNAVEPSRSFKPFSICVHFQQLKGPGKPSPFLFNTKARAAVCPECGYKNSDLDTMEAHKEIYCPALKKKKTAAGKRPSQIKSKRAKALYTLEIEKCEDRTASQAKYLVNLEIRNGLKEIGFGGIGTGVKDAAEIEQEIGIILRSAHKQMAGHPNVKNIGEGEWPAIVNKSDIPDEKINSMVVRAIESGLLKEEPRKEEWQPVKTVRPLPIPESRKVKKRPLYHDHNLVQGDLFSFFPQNQTDLFDFFEEDGPAQNVKMETTSSEDRPQNILILSCSQHKIERPARPIELYNGQSYRIVRKFLKENPDLNIEIYVLSAKYGLIDAMDPDGIIEPYDLKMDPEIASRWKEILERTIDKDRITRGNSFFYGSSLYYSVLPFEIPHSKGKIGEQLHQLKEWLESLRKEVIA